MEHETPSTSSFADQPAATVAGGRALSPSDVAAAPGTLRVIKRNGAVVTYDDDKIQIALTKAFLAVEGGTAAASSRIRDMVATLTAQVTTTFQRRLPSGGTIHIEEIQDQVELALMRSGEHKVARDYVLYREERARVRAANASAEAKDEAGSGEEILVVASDGERRPLDAVRMRTLVTEACEALDDVDPERIIAEARANMYDGIAEDDVATGLLMTARALVEVEPNYTYVTARLLLDKLRSEALRFLDTGVGQATQAEMASLYAPTLKAFVDKGVQLELLAPELKRFDLERLGAALKPERDLQFNYLGLQTLYDRYFIHSGDTRFELPQIFFMRVAMGLAIQEEEPEQRAIEFYNLLSSFDYMSSTPTLFNAGTLRSQLSSCFLTTVSDDLDGIYSAIRDNALLSKWAGGLGNDWTPVRALGAYIKGTNGKSQGVVPFLKVVNDTAVAVNQCFAPETRLHTGEGIKAIKDVVAGDLVLGRRGEYREVLQTMAYNQRAEGEGTEGEGAEGEGAEGEDGAMVDITVEHALRPLRVTTGHPLWAIPAAAVDGKPAWLDAGRLQPGDHVGQTIPQEVVPVAGFDADDARLYGILLGDGHWSKDSAHWGVSGNPLRDSHLDFVAAYLDRRGIHYTVANCGRRYRQLRFSTDVTVARDGTTGEYRSVAGGVLPFAPEDVYDDAGRKRFAPRLTHLPRHQTLALLHGLLDADGVGRGEEVCFTTTSEALAEGLRYQMLRLGVPTSGRVRERRCPAAERGHSDSDFDGMVTTFDVSIPAVPELAEHLDCQPVRERDWLAVNNWLFTPVRAVTPVEPAPFVFDLKVEGDESYMTTSAVAHNGGKRKGAVCSYLETWHLDIEEFLELRKNTGDDRRRTHDMNTANWVPDLFMKRVFESADWTLFSPNDTADLHDLYGAAFEARYLEYERMTQTGELPLFKRVKAAELWRKMLSMLFETGHPWITFKDSCNVRSPQQHDGVVHSSNLCTEITLNTSREEIAVCNLGSVNLAQHVEDGHLNTRKLKKTVRTAVRMLDNVIDINYYAVPQARKSNMRHRPVGLGIMGFQDALYKLGVSYASDEAVAFADESMEALSYFAIEASSRLAKERGSYASFEGSLWSRGVLPIDSLKRLGEERASTDYFDVDLSSRLDWDKLRTKVCANGMRNSNVMAIAPTATIANIVGVSQSIEPTYQNLYVKSNLSGEFTVVNPYMVHDLKRLGLWDKVMVNDLKYYDGSVLPIDRVPPDLKHRYATAFEVEPRWLVDAASRRQKWIDQAQSLNLYIANASGKKLDITYRMAWKRGLKTTYYLRALGATSAEKSTVDKVGGGVSKGLNAVAVSPQAAPAPVAPPTLGAPAEVPAACSIDDPDCEACQ